MTENVFDFITKISFVCKMQFQKLNLKFLFDREQNVDIIYIKCLIQAYSGTEIILGN